MALDKDDYFKREQDQKWRESVDHAIVMHTTVLKVIQDTLGEIRGDLNELDEIISGSAIAGTQGIANHLTEVARTAEKLDRIITKGDVGKKGLETRVEVLEDVRSEKRNRFSEWLRFWGPIVVAIVTSTALAFKSFPELLTIFKDDKETAFQHIENAEKIAARKTPHKKHQRDNGE